MHAAFSGFAFSGLVSSAWALLQVVFIDLALAGDNAVVVGMAVAGLPRSRRNRAIAVGIGAAALIRTALALVAVRLMAVIGLTLAGGLLLLWVCWRMLRTLRQPHERDDAGGAGAGDASMRQALLQIVLADLSMSLDNVLAVAGAAAGHPRVLVAGLVTSVLMTGIAAGLIARMLEKAPAIAWAGLAMVFAVALRMIWQGTHQVAAALG